jgi:hypothetical protein
MVTEEQLKEALKVIEDYKQQLNKPVVSGSLPECDHRGAWLTVKGHYYCPKCDFAFRTLKCKICSGKGGFDVALDKGNDH